MVEPTAFWIVALTHPVGATAFLAQDGQALVDLGTVGRVVEYLGLALVFGALGWGAIAGKALTRPGRESAHVAAMAALRRWVMVGGALLIVAAAVRLHAQVLAFRFPGDPITASSYRDIIASVWGRGWLAQAVAAALITVVAVTARPGGRGWRGVVFGTGALVFVTPLTGHAMGGELSPILALPLHGIHLAAGSTWLGALLLLVIVGYPVTRTLAEEEREAVRADLVQAFSPIALTGGMVAMAAGVLLAVAYLGAVAALWQSVYGRLLMAKVAAVLAAAALGAYNWRRLRPRLGAPGASAALRRSASWELFFGSVLLAATAMLVAQPMG